MNLLTSFIAIVSAITIDIEFTLKKLKLSFSMKGVDLVMILMLFISTGVKGLCGGHNWSLWKWLWNVR